MSLASPVVLAARGASGVPYDIGGEKGQQLLEPPCLEIGEIAARNFQDLSGGHFHGGLLVVDAAPYQLRRCHAEMLQRLDRHKVAIVIYAHHVVAVLEHDHARVRPDIAHQKLRGSGARQLVLASVDDEGLTADSIETAHHHPAQPVHLLDAVQRHPAVVKCLAALELRLDDRADEVVLDPERVFLLDAHALLDERHAIQEVTRVDIPGCRPTIDVDRRSEDREPSAIVAFPLHNLGGKQRTQAHADDMQRFVFGKRLAVFRRDRIEPVLGRHAEQILGPRPMSGQGERMNREVVVLEVLVHRAEVVLRAPESMHEEDAQSVLRR